MEVPPFRLGSCVDTGQHRVVSGLSVDGEAAVLLQIV